MTFRLKIKKKTRISIEMNSYKNFCNFMFTVFRYSPYSPDYTYPTVCTILPFIFILFLHSLLILSASYIYLLTLDAF